MSEEYLNREVDLKRLYLRFLNRIWLLVMLMAVGAVVGGVAYQLARAMRRGLRPAGDIRGSIDEELWDVIYYALAIANCYGIDMESVIPKKAAFNAQRYPDPEPFALDR